MHPALFPAIMSFFVSPTRIVFFGFTFRILQAFSIMSGAGFLLLMSSIVTTASKYFFSLKLPNIEYVIKYVEFVINPIFILDFLRFSSAVTDWLANLTYFLLFLKLRLYAFSTSFIVLPFKYFLTSRSIGAPQSFANSFFGTVFNPKSFRVSLNT